MDKKNTNYGLQKVLTVTHNPLHPQCDKVLREHSSIGIFGHKFTEYHYVLQDDIVLYLVGYSDNNNWYQQSGMMLHIAGNRVEYPVEIFAN
jgi:hypothetical protein